MQVKSIAECSKGSILQYFGPSLAQVGISGTNNNQIRFSLNTLYLSPVLAAICIHSKFSKANFITSMLLALFNQYFVIIETRMLK